MIPTEGTNEGPATQEGITMDYQTATSHGQTLATLHGRTFWVYRILGRGAKFQVTSTLGMATNGKILLPSQIVAECVA